MAVLAFVATQAGGVAPGAEPPRTAVTADRSGREACLDQRQHVKRKRVKSLAKRIVAPGAFVVTDGLACFRGVADAGCDHHSIATATSRHGAGHPSFHWLSTVLAKIKSSTVDTYKAVRKKHLARPPAEFEWRFNNRENLAAMIPRLASAAARSRPAPYSNLKWADYGA